MKKVTKGRTVKAYLTVEASFLIPFSIIVLLLIILLTFHLYNQCVVYQDCYIAALRGSQVMDSTDGEILTNTIIQAKELLANQIYQYDINPNVSVGAISITVSAESNISIPFYTMTLYREQGFDIKKEAECKRMDPVKLLRMKY